MGVAGAGWTITPYSGLFKQHISTPEYSNPTTPTMGVDFLVNKQKIHLDIDPRTSLLDALRENLTLPGTKKRMRSRTMRRVHGHLVNGRRINSCLTLAGLCQGAEITTIEGLADGDRLHPIQEAFIKHDAYQCGYCTPGQICSAMGLLYEEDMHTPKPGSMN